MKHIGINAKVASHLFSLLASVVGTTVCLEIPLQSPPPPPRETGEGHYIVEVPEVASCATVVHGSPGRSP